MNGDSLARALTLAVADDVDRRARRLPRGRYEVIVVDPPWAYDTVNVGYPVLTVEEIMDLPIPKLASEDCVLWLWTTNAKMRDAFTVVDSWGFAEQSILTWAKDRMGKGWYLRNQTEHCVLATKGQPRLARTSQTTLLRAPSRQHSRKPEEFYALVESLCPGRRLDMFARESRKGWATWGFERSKFDRVG